MNLDKPREFTGFIHSSGFFVAGNDRGDLGRSYDIEDVDLIHVIEKSAYDREFERRTNLSEKCGMQELAYDELLKQTMKLRDAVKLVDDHGEHGCKAARGSCSTALTNFDKYLKEIE